MSTQRTMLPDGADAPSDRSDPILSEQIQRHLGMLLAGVYAREDTEADLPARFADLLAKFDVAVGQARERDDTDFRQLLLVTTPALRRFAHSLTHNPTAADDLVQETLLRAWKSRAHFSPGTNFEAWAFTILRNQFYTDRRKRREVQDEDGSYAARLISLPDQAGHLDLQDFQAALARLIPSMREALMLVAVEGLSYEDAAAVMGCQIGTVKSRVSRGRERLVRLLGYAGSEVGNDAVTFSTFNRSGKAGT